MAPPPPTGLPPAIAARAPSARERKRKQRFGDNGELDGPASAFHSAQSARKASVDPAEEMGVPAYALPGETVWASARCERCEAKNLEPGRHHHRTRTAPTAKDLLPARFSPSLSLVTVGLHAGTRKRFKAHVTKLRKMFPRIVVKYIEDETGNAHRLALPDPITAYLTMGDIEPGTQ